MRPRRSSACAPSPVSPAPQPERPFGVFAFDVPGARSHPRLRGLARACSPHAPRSALHFRQLARAKRQGWKSRASSPAIRRRREAPTCAPLLSQHVVEFFAARYRSPLISALALWTRGAIPTTIDRTTFPKRFAILRSRLTANRPPGQVLGIRGVRQETRSTTSGVADASQ